MSIPRVEGECLPFSLRQVPQGKQQVHLIFDRVFDFLFMLYPPQSLGMADVPHEKTR